MKFGIIGLGRMGKNLAKNAIDHNHQVYVYNRTYEKSKEIDNYGGYATESIEKLVNSLDDKKVIWLMLPAGDVTNKHIDILKEHLKQGDIIINGANNHYKETIKKSKELKKLEINLMDIGVSGGIEGARNGASMMIGGSYEAYEHIKPLIDDLCVKNGYDYFGKSGSGHFVKMVHNGVEYGMMEAIGEGFEVLEKSEFELDYEKVSKVWSNGSVIRGWLMELLNQALKNKDITEFSEEIGQSGEGLWTLQEALKLKVSTPVITDAVYRRFDSKNKNETSNRVVQALRYMFGGHDDKNKI
ncbi:MAG: phosphogluconate dehydrogenase (NAD(+)-dependent, decarboxylating) [Candidatus Woesearchaeota archaeon]